MEDFVGGGRRRWRRLGWDGFDGFAAPTQVPTEKTWLLLVPPHLCMYTHTRSLAALI